MRERREIAARTDRTFLRNDGMDAPVQQFANHIDDFTADPAETERQNVSPQKHHGPHFRLGQRRTDAASMTAHEIEL